MAMRRRNPNAWPAAEPLKPGTAVMARPLRDRQPEVTLMSILFDRLTTTIERSLDFRLERANVIAGNLANVDTPDYTPTEVTFDEQLRQHLSGEEPPGIARTDAAHLDTGVEGTQAEMEFDYFALPNQDGNSVDLDHEMSKLSENQIQYRASTNFYNKRMALLKYAISEGGQG